MPTPKTYFVSPDGPESDWGSEFECYSIEQAAELYMEEGDDGEWPPEVTLWVREKGSDKPAVKVIAYVEHVTRFDCYVVGGEE